MWEQRTRTWAVTKSNKEIEKTRISACIYPTYGTVSPHNFGRIASLMHSPYQETKVDGDDDSGGYGDSDEIEVT